MMSARKIVCLSAVAFLAGSPRRCPRCGGAAGSSGLTVLQRWRLGGPGGWDYLTLDSSGQRLFISRGTHVDVVSTASGAVIGSRPRYGEQRSRPRPTPRTGSQGYTSNGKADSVTVFDLGTLKVIQETKIAAHPIPTRSSTNRSASISSPSTAKARTSRSSTRRASRPLPPFPFPINPSSRSTTAPARFTSISRATPGR